ncbi:dynamin family protein [Photobacterium leiognathi]|uniref:dynamin family protein n=1 Tax=Photobacterium leiognathi TaxID=553611 RepID=UPI00298182EA|nr:dynamin family protein [Photobacterium leiognathi]
MFSLDIKTNLSHDQLLGRYQLLCKACLPDSSMDAYLNSELAELERFIKHDLAGLTRKGCPDNITDILKAMDNELVRFREFCEFPSLATKSVVGIGGGFSAGKSSFINKLIGHKCLVAEVDPTTSMPAYVMKGQKESIQAINTNNCAISLTQDEFLSLTHEEKFIYGSQIGQMLKSAFITLPDFQWQNLAILDTPGYSKPEDKNWNERTDANLAKEQLNSANYIIWVVSAEAGVISEDDIKFLDSLDKKIPKYILVSRADKRAEEDVPKIVALIKTTLANRGVNVIDVVPYSTRKRANYSLYSLEPVIVQMDVWNKTQNALQFAQNFKRQFLAYQSFIEEEQRLSNRRLHKLNRILTLADDDELTSDAKDLIELVKQELQQLAELKDNLTSLNHVFFTKLKKIGDYAGVPLPEPNALELMDLKEIDLLGMLRQIRNEQGLEEPIINPFADLFSLPINPKAIARILRRETPPDYGLDALITGELFNQLPQLLRQEQPVDNIIKLLDEVK